MERIKVFTSEEYPRTCGDQLTSMINEWIDAAKPAEIIDIHSNSNKYGWMIIIHYRERIEMPS